MVIEMFPNMVDKTKEKYVILSIVFCVTCTCSFDFWMFHANYDRFPLLLVSSIAHKPIHHPSDYWPF